MNYQLLGRAVDWSDSKIPGQTELRVKMNSWEKLKIPVQDFNGGIGRYVVVR